jgi:hypothetical protein
MPNAIIYSAKPRSTELDGPISETGGSKISRNSDEMNKMTTIDPDDWRMPLVCYLENPSHITDRKVQRRVLKYVMLDNTLYHRTIDGLLLKYLGSDQSKIAMGEVYERIYGTHQSTHKLK